MFINKLDAKRKAIWSRVKRVKMVNASLPNMAHYSGLFSFEMNYNSTPAAEFYKKYGNVSYVLTIGYVLGIWWGQNAMKSRPPMELKGLLTVWNVFLSALSTMGAIRSWQNMVYLLREYGVHHVACDSVFLLGDPVSALWITVFCSSKVFELLDTAFLVARKKKVTFLHWFHHATTVFVYTHFFKDPPAMVRVFSCNNFSIHGVMYAYFALMSMRIHCPRPIAALITTGQIVQMLINMAVTLYTLFMVTSGHECDLNASHLFFCCSLFLYYIYSFSAFFYNKYLKGQSTAFVDRRKKVS